MRTRRSFFVSMVIPLIVMPIAAIAAQERGGQRGSAPAASGPAMTLTLPAFPDGGQIPVKFSQAAEGAAPGEGTSPAMSWANPPAGTQSFVLNMHDMTCIPGPCSNIVSSYRAFSYSAGSIDGPFTTVNGLFTLTTRAEGQVAFRDYPECGTAVGIGWTATRP